MLHKELLMFIEKKGRRMKVIKIIVIFSFFLQTIYPVNRLMINTTGKDCKTTSIIQALSHVSLVNDFIKNHPEEVKAAPVLREYAKFVAELHKKIKKTKKDPKKDAVEFTGLDSGIDSTQDGFLAWLKFLDDMPAALQKDFGMDFKKEMKIVFGASMSKEVPEEVKQDGKTWELKSFVASSSNIKGTGGHFYAYGKAEKSQWYLYEDFGPDFTKAERVSLLKHQEKEVGVRLKESEKGGYSKTEVNSALFTAFRQGWFNEDKEADTKRSVLLYFYEQVESSPLVELKKSLELLHTKMKKLAVEIGKIGGKKEHKKPKKEPKGPTVLSVDEVKRITELEKQFDNNVEKLKQIPDIYTPLAIEQIDTEVQEFLNKFSGKKHVFKIDIDHRIALQKLKKKIEEWMHKNKHLFENIK